MKPRPATRASVLALAAALAACAGELRFADLPDAGGDGAGDAALDASGDGAGDGDEAIPPTIGCGTAGLCLLPGELCCANGSSDTCVANSFDAGTCAGILIACDDTHDCSGTQVCCIEFQYDDGGGGIDNNKIGCKTPGECGGGVILCEVQGTPCPNGKTCQPATVPGLPPGYHQCL